MSKLGMPAEMPDMDFYGCPEYYVTAGLTLPTGDGNARFYAWVMKGNLAVPLYTAVSPPGRLLMMSRDASRTAEQTFNVQQLTVRRSAGH